MALIDKTYFVGLLSIPNLTTAEGVDAGLENSTELTRYISIYEPGFMQMILGDLYVEYVAHKAEAIWTTIEGKLKDATLFRSPLANYVFFNYYPDLCERNTGVGTMATKQENSELVTRTRLVRVWNDMVSQLWVDDGVLDYLYENRSAYETSEYSLPSWDDIRPINIFGL